MYYTTNIRPSVRNICARCALNLAFQTGPSSRIVASRTVLQYSTAKRRRHDNGKLHQTKQLLHGTSELVKPVKKPRSQTTSTPVKSDVRLFRQHVLAEITSVHERSADLGFSTRLGLLKDESRRLFEEWFQKIEISVNNWIMQKMNPKRDQFNDWLQRRLWLAYVKGGKRGISVQLRFIIQDHIANNGTSASEIVRQSHAADLRFPAEWNTRTRKMNRQIHLHIGPTNSGKTYHALQRLKKAERGVYAGPLRLLAHEVHGRMLASGRSCNMITGDERIISEDPKCGLVSSTVEMVPLNLDFDVAVIDEIQMIENAERGWAWTDAFLGLSAKEIHLCGEARVLPLIKQLVASTCDTLFVHEYERLSPLRVGTESLENLANVKPGDCVVVFSRAQIHAFRSEITHASGRKVAVVYGSLPPETRAEQARLFNDPDSGYDILVASNAIGMGLNLSIKRIIFASVVKYDGTRFNDLETTDVKQIGGRAGRFRSSFQQNAISIAEQALVGSAEKKISEPMQESGTPGVVTTLREEDLPFIEQHMARDSIPVQAACLKIPDRIVVKYASYFPPQTPLSYIFTRLRDVARLNGPYFIGDMQQPLELADTISSVENLSLEDRLLLCNSPARMDIPVLRLCFVAMADCIAKSKVADIFTLPIPIAVLDEPVEANMQTLTALEHLHQCLTLYMWLSFRFVGIFTSQALAQHIRSMAEQRISETLTVLAEAGKIRKHFRNARARPATSTERSHIGSSMPQAHGKFEIRKFAVA